MKRTTIRPPLGSGKARTVSGKWADLAISGGRIRLQGDDRAVCDCSAPLDHTDQNGVTDKLCYKGVSCYHTATRLMYVFAARGWSFDEIDDLVRTRQYKGFLWFLSADALDTEYYYARCMRSVAEARKERFALAVRRAGRSRKTTRIEKSFTYNYSVWRRILDYIIENPGMGTRELERHLCTNEGGKYLSKGILAKYLQRAIALGYLRTKTGKNRKKQHFVKAYPPAPGRAPMRYRIKGESDTSYFRLFKAQNDLLKVWWAEETVRTHPCTDLALTVP